MSTHSEKMNMNFDLVIIGGTIVTMDSTRRIYQNGIIGINDNRITFIEVGDYNNLNITAAKTINARNKVILPGLINTHTHAAMTLFRGYADDLDFDTWLKKIWNAESKFTTADNIKTASEIALLEMISCGTTTIADMYWLSDITAEVAKQIGNRLVTGPTIMDSIADDGLQKDNRDQAARDFLEKYKNDPLISTSIQVHSTYTVSYEMLQKIASFVHEYDSLFMTHVSETEAENKFIHEKYNKTPVELLDSLDLLSKKTLLVHGIYLSDDDLKILADKKVSVAHCPESNLKLGNGIARISKMLSYDINVSLGTDGPATNNDLDLWGELRLAALLQKGVNLNPELLPAEIVMRMATINGAKALNMADKIGSIEIGKLADLIIIDFDKLHLCPVYDIYSHLVYSVSKNDIQTVIINGEIIMKERQFTKVDASLSQDKIRKIASEIYP